MRILYVFHELIPSYIYRTFETAVFDKQNFFYLNGDQIKYKIYLLTRIHILVSYKIQLKIWKNKHGVNNLLLYIRLFVLELSILFDSYELYTIYYTYYYYFNNT